MERLGPNKQRGGEKQRVKKRGADNGWGELDKDTAKGERISETTTGFFFLTGQNGSFFLFFRECNPSFHNSGKHRGQIRERRGLPRVKGADITSCWLTSSETIVGPNSDPCGSWWVPEVMSILWRSSSSLLIFSSSSLCTVSNSSSFSL